VFKLNPNPRPRNKKCEVHVFVLCIK